MVDYDPVYDPPRVSWQTDALYRIEHARRVLREAKRQAREVIELRQRYDAQRVVDAARFAEWERRWSAHRETRRPWSKARWRAYEEQERVAAERRKAVLERFGTLLKRNRWVYEQKLQGRKLKDIGEEAALSRERVRQICMKEARLDEAAKRRAAKHWLRPNPGRVVDIDAAGGCGGPRDIWLTYMPPADPRLDNMEPVSVRSMVRP